MNINAKWMNSSEDEGLMKWLSDIMSDWLIAQCWKFKWKSTHRREFIWLFCDLCSLEHILCKNWGNTELENFFCRSFFSDFGTNLTENSVSGDLEHRDDMYICPLGCGKLPQERNGVGGVEAPTRLLFLFAERLMNPLLSNTMLFPREKDGNACIAPMPRKETLWFGVCRWVLEKVPTSKFWWRNSEGFLEGTPCLI